MQESPANETPDPRATGEALPRLLALRERAVPFAYSVLRDFHAAEDAYQEAVVVALKRIAELEGGSVDPWFWTVLRNVVGTRIRSAKRSRVVFDSELVERIEGVFRAGAAPLPEEEVDLLIRCLGRVEGKARDVLKWRLLDGLDCPEIASRLRRTVSATYAVLKRTRAAVRACVEAHAGDSGAFRRPSP